MSGSVLSLVDAARLEQLITEDIANAVAAERERCAKIVESLRDDCVFDEEVAYELTALAAKIRSGE